MQVTFCGGARTVTGANYLLEFNDKKYLVECGLTQGGDFAEQHNYQPFSYDPKDIEAVFITHAHIDHIGLIPKLYKEGFRGKIYATDPTVSLATPMLKDAFKILRYECQDEKKPLLYEEEDLNQSLQLLQGFPYREKHDVAEDVTVRFRDAGHILGSAIVELWIKEDGKTTKLVFSGDLGNPPTPFLCSTEAIKDADYVFIESTYGNRLHEDKSLRKNLLEDAIEDTVSSGGTLMIPSFALERTQELLYELNELIEHNRIPKAPIFIDSPLAIKLTDIYKKYPDYFNKKAKYFMNQDSEIFDFPGLQLTKTVTESKTINSVASPKIVIAGSGMSNGGRILHHERRYLPDKKSMLLIIAWQPAGSLGRRVLNGEKQVYIFRKPVRVRCKVRAIGGYSAHPDKKGLMKWIKGFNYRKIKKVFVIQGEEDAALALVNNIQDNLGIEAVAPLRDDKFKLS
jgi:metallo-beta-lactamase family protein